MIETYADQLTAEQVANARAFVAAYQPWLERIALEHVMGGRDWLMLTDNPPEPHKIPKAPPQVDGTRERAYRKGYSKGFLAAVDLHTAALVPAKKLNKIKAASEILLGRWRAEDFVYGAPRANPDMGATVGIKSIRDLDAPKRRSYFDSPEVRA